MRAVVALLVVIVTIVVGGIRLPLHAAQTVPATAGLADYASGDFAGALASVRTAADLDAVYESLSANGTHWIDAGADAGAVAHRRLIAAAFALEVAGHKLADEVASPGHAASVRCKLVAWGGAVLTTRRLRPLQEAPRPDVPVQAAERVWFLAAIAVLESNGWNGLIDPQTGVMKQSPPPPYPLVPLALARFPDEPRLLLARAAAEEHLGWPAAEDRAQLPARLEADIGNPWTNRAGLLHDALRDYEKLTSSDLVGAEAHLRAGYVQLALGDREGARTYFAGADRAEAGATVRYVSRLLTGWSFERDRRPAEAERAYRAALEICPRAPSASTLLGALLFTTDRPSEVPALLEAALSGTNAVPDPWDEFTAVDRAVPALMAALRAELK